MPKQLKVILDSATAANPVDVSLNYNHQTHRPMLVVDADVEVHGNLPSAFSMSNWQGVNVQ